MWKRGLETATGRVPVYVNERSGLFVKPEELLHSETAKRLLEQMAGIQCSDRPTRHTPRMTK